MIELENVSVTFGAGTPNENCALKNVSLSVNKGDFISVIGSNGAGKSTLQNVIAGSVLPTEGAIFMEVDGVRREVTREKEYRRARYIGRIFQDPLLGTAGKMSLEDNLVVASKKGFKGLKISLNSHTRGIFRQQLAALGMGLEGRLKDNVALFSGGQRQALTLLMAVMSRPELLLLDEHTAALDPASSDLVMDLTQKFATSLGLSVMMVTHNMQQALDCGNRLLMMDSGRVILDADEDEKRRLTVDGLVSLFRQIKKSSLASDKMLLG